jgi:hypothetical protein
MLAQTSVSPVVLSVTSPLIDPDSAAIKDCVIINIIAAKAHASVLRAE